jgi:c-di-GMP-binding flagellar brake protein YcgR
MPDVRCQVPVKDTGIRHLTSNIFLKEVVMFDAQYQSVGDANERRKFPRYPVMDRMSLVVEDESMGESIGIGAATDISHGGLRVRYLPENTVVQAGDHLGLLLINEEQALSLSGEVVHHGTSDSFGVEFRNISPAAQRAIDNLVQRLNQ